MVERGKVGLVLSGGGAKGAYQVGVLKALAELGMHVDVVAGASIGALNGAVLVSAPSLEAGVGRLQNLWLQLAESSPLTVNMPGYVSLLLSLGLRMRGTAAFDVLLKLVQRAAQRAGVQLPTALKMLDAGLLSDEPLQRLMNDYLDTAAFSQSRPFYLSVYKSIGGLGDMLQVLCAELGILETPESEFLHFQSLSEAEQVEALLASAAIPVLFAPRQVAGSLYSDGGQGGWQRQQGNTPITPLLQVGCNTVIVSHLNDGSLWSRQEFPGATILEIRPQTSLGRGTGPFGGFKDVLGFDGQKIPSWIDQGYGDAMYCLERVMSASWGRNSLYHSVQVLERSEDNGSTADAKLKDAMAKLI